jgi:hypothetical protein
VKATAGQWQRFSGGAVPKNIGPSSLSVGDGVSDPSSGLSGVRLKDVKRYLQGVDIFPVSDAFELAVELGGRIVGVAVFFLVFVFGLSLFEGMVEIGLGESLE